MTAGKLAGVAAVDGRWSHHVGMVGEGRFIAFAAGQGWDIYRGVDGHTACDFIVDTGSQLLRVEVKRIESTQRTDNNYYFCAASKLHRDSFDYIFVSTPQGDYWVPAAECPAHTLSIKQAGTGYARSITRPGKYEVFRVEP